MDRLDAMRLFVRVAELGSFSAAARQLGLARSVVTRQIVALESHLGVTLMVRTTRRLTLTSAGTTYLERCRVILDLVDSAETDVADERRTARGHIRISLPLSYGLTRLAPLLLEFSRLYPELSLDMDYTDRRVKLVEEGLDLSIRVTGRLQPGDIARRIGGGRVLVLASPHYLERHGNPAHPCELIGHQCLGYTGATASAGWQFLVDGRLQHFPVQSRIHANNGDVLAEAAAQGPGISCQPDFIGERFLADGRLVEILGAYPLPGFGVYALLASNRHIPQRVRMLIDFFAGHLAAPPPAAE